MEIVIVRGDKRPWGIDGHLYINRKRICDTVEHPTRHKPNGTYSVELDNNPFRHGDGALASTLGEIIVGQSSIPGLVTQSQATYDRLYERLKKAWQRHTPIRLKIVG
jgi:hypothetical protein